jgi:DUF4097 and DUF4098 domain-containing protein YvlB
VALIAGGVAALLVTGGKLRMTQLWEWYARWWPLLLVAIGIVALAERRLDKQNPYPARRSYAGFVFLVLLLAVAAYGDRGMRKLGALAHPDGDDFFYHFLGEEHDAERSLDRAIPAGAVVEIAVQRGDVAVAVSPDAEIHVQAHEVVYARDRAEARRGFARLEPRLSVSGNIATLESGESGGDQSGHSDLMIQLPSGASAAITEGHGDVTVDGGKAPVRVISSHGDVKLGNIASSGYARLSDGSFTASSIAGDVTLEGRLDDVSISDVRGQVHLQGDFFGDTSLLHVASAVDFHSTRTEIHLAGLPGGLTLGSGDLHLDAGAGPARITTSAKDIGCTGITGDLHIEDVNGDVSVSTALPLGAIQIHNRNGDVTLRLPKNASFHVEASARTGDVDSAFPLPPSSAGPSHSVAGAIGAGGPGIELLADHGDIHLGRVESGAAISGGKNPRHLRDSRGEDGQGVKDRPTVL